MSITWGKWGRLVVIGIVLLSEVAMVSLVCIKMQGVANLLSDLVQCWYSLESP